MPWLSGCAKLLSGSEIKPNSSHSDLWTDIAQSLRDRQGITAITRVGAHQIEGHARDVFTEWCIKHNSLADRQAVRANCSRPPEFWQVFWMHSQAVENITLINRAIQELQLAVSREVVRHEEPQFVEVSPLEMELPTPVQPWITLPPLRIPAQAVRWYGDALVRIILSWFWQSVDGSSHALTWMSHYQLYIDFMCSTGQPGPVHLSRWVDGASISNISLRGFAFRQRLDGSSRFGRSLSNIWALVWKRPMAGLTPRLSCLTLVAFHCHGIETAFSWWTSG